MESIGSSAHICETELGLDEDEEDMYHWDPEGPYVDELILEEGWLTKYSRELYENKRRNQELQNRFERIRLNPRGFRSISHLWIISLKNLIIRCRRLRVVPIVERGDFYARLRFARSTITLSLRKNGDYGPPGLHMLACEQPLALAEQSESRENARASGQGPWLARSRGSLRSPKQESLLAG